jgi:tetratricopeptide (TPR) repeat protein
VRDWKTLARTHWLLLAAAGCVLVAGVVSTNRWGSHPTTPAPREEQPQSDAAGGYADPASCASCHRDIAATYRLTGMARSLSTARPDDPRLAESGNPVPNFARNNRLHHAASDRDYTMLERDGVLLQRRHQRGFGGSETNVLELTADYVIGSGNHARTFVHRAPDGRLLQLPVTWYADGGGRWAMSPGYDRPAHLDFRRVIDEGCMSCHNGYPREPVRDAGTGPMFSGALPEGIDCQRCHGPGQRHLEALKAGDRDAARRAIVNPATLDRERQLDVCMQCHLEPTSAPLPFQIRRYEQAPFSYRPGTPLTDTFLYFDRAGARVGAKPGLPAIALAKADDRFEIAGAAYRLRQSACFQRSQMTCGTCHNPHDVPRGERAVQHYVAACRSCHETTHARGVPRLAGAGPRSTCVDCHMPKRRAEDAVHVVITDHFIQRARTARDLTAPLEESVTIPSTPYQGEVVPYYPATAPTTPQDELYVALAQVQQGANLTAGIPRLKDAIARHAPERPEFYYELARAYAKTSDHAAVIEWSEAALRKDATFAAALKELANAAAALGQWERAAQALQRAVALRPDDTHALADLGNVYLQGRRVDEAIRVLQQAVARDASLPRASNTLGLAFLARTDPVQAERHFREAIRQQPDLAEAHNNLANLLAGRRAYAEAAHHFEQALRSDANYAAAHHGYGLVLALTKSYDQAVAALQAAVRLAPGLARAHTDLADVFAAMGRLDDAAREYARAVEADPQDYEAHYGLGEILAGRRRSHEAAVHFQAAAESPDPALREAARTRLAVIRP